MDSFNLPSQIKKDPLRAIALTAWAYDAAERAQQQHPSDKSKCVIMCQLMKTRPPSTDTYYKSEVCYTVVNMIGMKFTGPESRSKSESISSAFSFAYGRIRSIITGWSELLQGRAEFFVAADHGVQRVADSQERSDRLLALLGQLAQSGWLRDLTIEGIEPNPGPKNQGSKKPQSKKKRQSIKKKTATTIGAKVVVKTRTEKQKKQAVVIMKTVPTMAPNNILFQDVGGTFNGAARNAKDSMLGAFVDAFVTVAMHVASPAPTDVAPISGVITPGTLKAYILHGVLTILRRSGLLDASIFAAMPDFPDERPLPVGLLNILAYFMPYTEGTGSLKATYQNVFNITPTVITNNANYDIGNSGFYGSSGSYYNFNTLSVAVFNTVYREYNQDPAATSGTFAFANVWNGAAGYDDIGSYLAGVYPCVPMRKHAKVAPDGSVYGYAYCDSASSILRPNQWVSAAREYTLMVSEISRAPADGSGFSGRAGLNVDRIGGMYSEIPSVDDPLLSGILNYALCSLDMSHLGPIPVALSKSKWKGLTSFIPNLSALDTTQFHTLLWAVVDRLSCTPAQAMSLVTVCESKLLHLLRRATIFQNKFYNFDVFGEEPVPPAIAAYFAGLGPVISNGRVTYLAPTSVATVTTSAASNSWLNRLCVSNTPSAAAVNTLWAPVLGYISGTTMNTVTYNTTNFPAATFTNVVKMPVIQAKQILPVYQQIPSYQSFIPVEYPELGAPECVYFVEINVLPLENSAILSAQNSGLSTTATTVIRAVYSPIVGGVNDAMRACLFGYRTCPTALASNICIQFSKYNIFGLNMKDLARGFGEFVTSGSGYTYIQNRIAQEEAVREREESKSFAGVTTPASNTNVMPTHVVKEVVNEFTSALTERVRGEYDHAIHDVVESARKGKFDYTFADYLPVFGQALARGVKNGAKRANQRMQERMLEVASDPKEIMRLGKGTLNAIFN